MQPLDRPAVLHEANGQIVQQLRMRRLRAGDAKVAGRVDQSDSEVVLRTADRQQITVARSDIEEMQKSPKSLMPDSVLADLTADEAADLLAYIRSLSEAK